MEAPNQSQGAQTRSRKRSLGDAFDATRGGACVGDAHRGSRRSANGEHNGLKSGGRAIKSAAIDVSANWGGRASPRFAPNASLRCDERIDQKEDEGWRLELNQVEFENSNDICSSQGMNVVARTPFGSCSRPKKKEKKIAMNAVAAIDASHISIDLGLDAYEHSYQSSSNPAASDDFETMLGVLFEREANDSMRADLLGFRANAEAGAAGSIYGCNAGEFENLVVNYYERNGTRYKYSSQTTSLAIQFYVRYISSIVNRLQTERDMKLVSNSLHTHTPQPLSPRTNEFDISICGV